MTLLRLVIAAVLVASWGCDDATKTRPVVSNPRSLAADKEPEQHEEEVEKLVDGNKIVTCKPQHQMRDNQNSIGDEEGNLITSGSECWLVLDDGGNSIRFLLHVWPPSGPKRQGARELGRLREDREYVFTLETPDDSTVMLTRVTDGKNVIFEGRFRGSR